MKKHDLSHSSNQGSGGCRIGSSGSLKDLEENVALDDLTNGASFASMLSSEFGDSFADDGSFDCEYEPAGGYDNGSFGEKGGDNDVIAAPLRARTVTDVSVESDRSSGALRSSNIPRRSMGAKSMSFSHREKRNSSLKTSVTAGSPDAAAERGPPRQGMGQKSVSFCHRSENQVRRPLERNDDSSMRSAPRRNLGARSMSFSRRSSKMDRSAAYQNKPFKQEPQRSRKPSLNDCSNHVAKRTTKKRSSERRPSLPLDYSNHSSTSLLLLEDQNSDLPHRKGQEGRAARDSSQRGKHKESSASLGSSSGHTPRSRHVSRDMGTQSQSFSVRRGIDKRDSLKDASLKSSFSGDLDVAMPIRQEFGNVSPTTTDEKKTPMGEVTIKRAPSFSSESSSDESDDFQHVTLVHPEDGGDHKVFLQFTLVSAM